VGPFETALDAPNDLGEILLDGISPSEKLVSITPGKDIALSWEGESYGDEVIVQISWRNMGLSWSINCRLKDDGYFVISRNITDRINTNFDTLDNEMSLSRVRQVSFRANGMSFGDFSFVASTSFLIKFEGND
jgi:hypothetical protein